MGKNSKSNPAGIVLIRLLTGFFLFGRGWSWVNEGGFDGALVLEHVRASLGDLSGLLHWWGKTVLLANPDASALFWRWGALLIGVSFLLGALTRPAGFIACGFLLQGIVFGPEANELLFTLLIFPCLGCAVGAAGRDFGLDKMLDESAPGWLTWTNRRRGGKLFN